MPDLEIGELRQRVTWQTSSSATTPTSAGQKLNNWTSQGEYWAKVEPLSGRELYVARQLQADLTHRITIRLVGPIKVKDRFWYQDPVYGDRYLYAQSVRRLNDLNEYLIIEANEPKDHP